GPPHSQQGEEEQERRPARVAVAHRDRDPGSPGAACRADLGSASDRATSGVGCLDSRPGAAPAAARRQPELGSAGPRARSGCAADVGLGPTRAFLGCAAGRLTRRHIDIDVGRASPDRSAVSRLGRAGNSAIAHPTGRAASAATRVSAASSAATPSRTASTTSSRRAAPWHPPRSAEPAASPPGPVRAGGPAAPPPPRPWTGSASAPPAPSWSPPPPPAAPAPPPPIAPPPAPPAPPIPMAERTIIAPPAQHESTTVIPAWQPPPAPAASTGAETQPILRAQTGAGPQAQLNIESGPDAGNNHRAGD